MEAMEAQAVPEAVELNKNTIQQMEVVLEAKERALLEPQLATIPADDSYDAVRLWRRYTTEQRRR